MSPRLSLRREIQRTFLYMVNNYRIGIKRRGSIIAPLSFHLLNPRKVCSLSHQVHNAACHYSPLEIKSLTLRSKTLRLRRTWCWHLRHLIAMSAPGLTTCHSSLPQGCFFLRRTTSPSFISMLIAQPDLFSYFRLI